MSDAFVQVAPDDPTGKKIQTYEGTISGQDVHAQAVVLVDSSGVPYTPGNVVGPASVTDGDLAVFDGTTGKLIKDGGAVPLNRALNADAPNSTIAINVLVGAPATIVSKSITYIAGDTVVLKIWGSILNNSGSDRSYFILFSMGGMTMTSQFNATVITSSTARTSVYIEMTIGVLSTSSAWMNVLNFASSAGNPLGSGKTITAQNSLIGAQHSTSDLTGAQTTSVKMYADANTTTQSFELNAWTIEKFGTNP